MVFSIKFGEQIKDIEFRFNEDMNWFSNYYDGNLKISISGKEFHLSDNEDGFVIGNAVKNAVIINIDGSEIKLEFVKQLLIEYNINTITQLVDTEIIDGCWVDDDWEDDGDFSDEYEWYIDFGRGEAEDVVMEEIINFLIDKVGITKELYLSQANENMYETIQNMFQKLETV